MCITKYASKKGMYKKQSKMFITATQMDGMDRRNRKDNPL